MEVMQVPGGSGMALFAVYQAYEMQKFFGRKVKSVSRFSSVICLGEEMFIKELDMSDKKCGLCNHYKVGLSGQDTCRLLRKNIRSLDVACDQYNKEGSQEVIESSVVVKKSCAEGEC